MAQRKSTGGGVALTSDEVNYLVYRYLQESTFTHSAFTFAHESMVHKSRIDPNQVPVNALVTFIQKGMQFIELEANVEDGEVTDFAQLDPKDLLTKDIDELRQLAMEKREQQAERRASHATKAEKTRERAAERKRDRAAMQATASVAPKFEEAQAGPGSAAGLEIANVTTLHGHESEVFACAWSPAEGLLASANSNEMCRCSPTCSGESSARIWDLRGSSSAASTSSTALVHEVRHAGSRDRDVSAMAWAPNGQLLATGSVEGPARIWTKDGKLKHTLSAHTRPISALRFSKDSSMLVSGGVDNAALVWDAKNGLLKQRFEFHTGPVMDVDWRNRNSFATCSPDKAIHVCQLGKDVAVKTFVGHDADVNAIRWDPSSTLLASGSDDNTAMIWSMTSDTPVHVLSDHQQPVYTLRWRPGGPGSAQPSLQPLLATGSFDGTAKLWDAETGRCLHTLAKHTQGVYSVAFSPNGRYLATGSFDKHLHIWDVDSGALAATFNSEGEIWEVSWDVSGERVAVSLGSKLVQVVELRMPR